MNRFTCPSPKRITPIELEDWYYMDRFVLGKEQITDRDKWLIELYKKGSIGLWIDRHQLSIFIGILSGYTLDLVMYFCYQDTLIKENSNWEWMTYAEKKSHYSRCYYNIFSRERMKEFLPLYYKVKEKVKEYRSVFG